MIKVLIADDHAIVRRGLQQILDETTDLKFVDEAVDGFEVLEKVRSMEIDILVLDISLPGINGLDVLKQLHVEFPKLPVLVLSIFSEDQYAMRVLKAGACGYLSKESAPDELVIALRKIATGGRYVSSYMAEKLAFEFSSGAKKAGKLPHELLSDREYQVLCLIASGKSSAQIADVLNLSVKTVGTYRSRIFEKTAMKNNAELTHYAFKNKLIQ